MKIITWNCNMAFRKKYEHVVSMKPDLLVIQECENEQKLESALEKFDYNEIIWCGKNPNKGIAVISFNEYRIEINEKYNDEYEYIIPINVQLDESCIQLFAVWAMPHKTNKNWGYVGQLWRAVHEYESLFTEWTIMIGDFNSNTMWDKQRKVGNHTDLVQFLSQRNISSVYHQQLGIDHGGEKDPTLYLLKNKNKPYHMDYCFVSDGMINTDTRIHIGKIVKWLPLSDHMPVIIDHLDI